MTELPSPAPLNAAFNAAPAAAARYGFDESKSPEGTVFDVVPPPMAWGALGTYFVMLIFVGAFMVPLLTGVVALILGMGMGTWFFITVLGWLGLLALPYLSVSKIRHLRRPRKIEITAAGLVLEGTLYSRDHIKALWVQVPNGPSPAGEDSTTVIVAGNTVSAVGASLQQASSQAGRQLGSFLAARMNRVGYGVSMRYGADVVEVVAGLEEGAATALEQRLRACLQA